MSETPTTPDPVRRPRSVLAMVVAYWSGDTLSKSLASIRDGAPDDLTIDVAVWDNSPDPRTAETCADLGTSLTASPTNVGFARANNELARRHPGSDWLLLLNPDAWLQPSFWSAASAAMVDDADIVVPALVDEAGNPETRIVAAPTPVTELIYALGGGPGQAALNRFAGHGRSTYASGACLLIRREAWQALGGFDERYFLFGEDADLFARARSLGLRVAEAPGAVATHLGSKGTASKTSFAQLCLVSAKVSYLREHYGIASARLVHGAYRMGGTVRRILLRARGNHRRAAVWRATTGTTFAQTLWFRWVEPPSSSPTVLMWPGRSKATANPYITEYQNALERRGVAVFELDGWRTALRGASVLHVHWPDAVVNTTAPKALRNTCGLLAIAALARWRGTRVVWTVHNLRPHEGRHPRLANRFMRMWASLVDGTIHHSEFSRARVDEEYPTLAAVPTAVCLHPSFVTSYGGPLPPWDAARLDRARRVITFVGTLRRYKHIDGLLDSFASSGLGEWTIGIYGADLDTAYVRELEAQARRLGLTDAIHVGFLLNDEVRELLTTTDLLVAPVEASLNSGMVILGLSLGVPVLAPRTGTNVELSERFPDAALLLYDPPMTAFDLERAAFSAARSDRRPAPLPTWDELAAAADDLYRRAIAVRSASPLASRSREHVA